MKDMYGREIDYMRVSITDRCNLRCVYCMPGGIRLVPMSEILTFEEIAEVVRAGTGLGIKKVKITGGDPLVRKGCPDLVMMIKNIPGIEQVTMTTNGILLEKYLDQLIDAGLDSINVSLDTLDRERYERITGFDELGKVLAGIDAAIQSGIRLKINSVLQKSFNEDDALSLIDFAVKKKIDLRFIELMPVGIGRLTEGVSNEEIFSEVKMEYPDIKKEEVSLGNGPAVYYRIPGTETRIGFISAINRAFCDSCNRIRLTSKGMLKPCLCYEDQYDLKGILRSGEDENKRAELLKAMIEKAVINKPGHHCFNDPDRAEKDITRNYMAEIGG